MIVDALLNALKALLRFVAALLPDWDPGAVLQSWGLVTNNLAALNYFLPISEVFGMVLSVFYVLPLFLGTSVLLWVVAFVRGGSARA